MSATRASIFHHKSKHFPTQKMYSPHKSMYYLTESMYFPQYEHAFSATRTWIICHKGMHFRPQEYAFSAQELVFSNTIASFFLSQERFSVTIHNAARIEVRICLITLICRVHCASSNQVSAMCVVHILNQ